MIFIEISNLTQTGHKDKTTLTTTPLNLQLFQTSTVNTMDDFSALATYLVTFVAVASVFAIAFVRGAMQGSWD